MLLTLLALTTDVVFRPYIHPVATWVAPHAIAESKVQLSADFGGVGMKDALTHLNLQFWQPALDGSVGKVTSHGISDETIKELRDWGHSNGIRVMLCVFNGAGPTWDSPLAKAGFAEQPDKFVTSLLAEVKRLDLDGVDVDLEGKDIGNEDKPAFLTFMKKLSTALAAEKKHLTVDTFAYIWHAPNQTWWPELLPLVNGLTSMGYAETGASGIEWRSYAAQKKAAGEHAAKLQLGMPSNQPSWLGNSALEQLEWVRKNGGVGVAIWDAQLSARAWRTKEAWTSLKAIGFPSK